MPEEDVAEKRTTHGGADAKMDTKNLPQAGPPRNAVGQVIR